MIGIMSDSNVPQQLITVTLTGSHACCSEILYRNYPIVKNNTVFIEIVVKALIGIASHTLVANCSKITLLGPAATRALVNRTPGACLTCTHQHGIRQTLIPDPLLNTGPA